MLLAGCGSSSTEGETVSAEPTSTAAFAPSKSGPKLKVIDSDYGRILADGHGRALYLFTADHGPGSDCSGACAVAWPPYIVKSRPVAGRGTRGGLPGTTKRSGGALQATYAGHPLYYYEGDRARGEVNCQAAYEFGGYWYVIRANGAAVK